MKRFLSVLFFAAMLCLIVIPASAEFSRDRWYEMGLTALEDGTPQALEMAIDYFDAAGNYDQAKNYKQYCQYLTAILAMDGEMNTDINTVVAALKRLGKKDDFEASLQAHGFYSCQILIAYIEARQLETAGDIAKAWHAYYAIDDVLDAGDRLDALTARVYQIGVTALNQGKYREAIEILKDLDYTDSEILLARAEQQLQPPATPTPPPTPTPSPTPSPSPSPSPSPTPRQLSLSVGQTFIFGSFEQDNRSSNGKEPIEWIVLAVDSNQHKALLISKYILYAAPYNNSRADVTWYYSSIRKWLNNYFLETAFTSKQQKGIIYTYIPNDSDQSNSAYRTNAGGTSRDYVFLLSYAEASRYFSDKFDRRTAPTDYAIALGAYHVSRYQPFGRDAGWWWLRSPGKNQDEAIYVDNPGTFESIRVNKENGGVRPAMWIDLNAGVY